MTYTNEVEAELPLSGDSAFLKHSFSLSIKELKEKVFYTGKLEDIQYKGNIFVHNSDQGEGNSTEQNKVRGNLEQLSRIVEIWVGIAQENLRIYSIITTQMLTVNLLDEEDEDISLLLTNIELVADLGKLKLGEKSAFWDSFVAKIIDHIQLAQHQQNTFSQLLQTAVKQNELLKSNTENTLKDVNKLKNQLSNLEDKLKKLNKQNQGLIDKQKKTQKDFISILGIFAAILLASFGGLTVISNVLKEYNAPIGKIMILASLSIFAVLVIIFLLLNGISKLTGEGLRNCNCTDVCNCSLSKKHPTIFKSFVVVSIIFVMGSFEMLIDFNELKTNLNNDTLIFGLFFVIACILISAFYFEIQGRKLKEENQSSSD